MRSDGTRKEREVLADLLKALGHPTRLDILEALRMPRLVTDIRVETAQAYGGEGRTAARQTVQAHLDKLLEAGLVAEEAVDRGDRILRRYGAQPQRLYQALEEMRVLATAYAGVGPEGPEATLPCPQEAAPEHSGRALGPRLALVHGLPEGRLFRLDPRLSQGGRWTIGRSRESWACLDYDPYVSLDQAVVTQEGREFLLADLRGSRNPTRVNWAPLAKEAPHRLKAGDVVGVGRSLLVFQA